MRVLVCGGRDFMDRMWLFRELNELHYSRACAGYANPRGFPLVEFAHSHAAASGPRAGLIAMMPNAALLKNCEAVAGLSSFGQGGVSTACRAA